MKEYYEKILLNAKINEVNRICDLIRFKFVLPNEEVICLHVTCYIRIYDCNGLLTICSSNLLNRSPNYRKKWYKKYDWTQVGATIFDDALRDNMKNIISTKIKKFKFNNNDIEIILENKMRIEVLVNVTKYDDEDYYENYRIFSADKEKEHFVV